VPDFEATLTATSLVSYSSSPTLDFNMAQLSADPAAPARLRAFQAELERRGHPGLLMLTDAAIADLAPVAAMLGFQHAATSPLLLRSTVDLPPDDDERYDVQPITDTPTLAAARRALSAEEVADDDPRLTLTLRAPGVTRFLARRRADGELMSVVTSVRAGDVTGLWGMHTPARHQRQGAGRATLLAALRWERARGARWCYLCSSNAGLALYEHAGFQLVGRTELWVYGADPSALEL
jgi:GNAT superfamily N-acetyltransferase